MARRAQPRRPRRDPARRRCHPHGEEGEQADDDQPTAAAEIQQSLLPPRISRTTGGEVAGNVLPSYEVAGDWFDVIENPDGVWVSIADGLGGSTQAAASSATTTTWAMCWAVSHP